MHYATSLQLHTQHDSKIVEWMSDAGGEYKLDEFSKVLKDLGIKSS